MIYFLTLDTFTWKVSHYFITSIFQSLSVVCERILIISFIDAVILSCCNLGVKIHEYYHNINGSQVTGESPFEIWLNEAVTVFIQRQRENVLFGADYMRLKEVLYSFTPGQGPLAIDASPNAMPIEPRGFNRTQELISAMTYSKAPEFVNMIELMIGTPAFNRGLDLYHTKFSYSNATTDDWIRSMEEASGQSLMPMANGWLRRSGHPHVLYSGSYNSADQTYTIQVEQTRLPKDDPTPWILPIDYALVKNGSVMTEGVHTMKDAKETITIRNVASEPDFLSFARGWSFFGTHANTGASIAQLSNQALSDPDVINRYFSYRAIVDGEKATIIEKLVKKDTNHTVSSDVVKLHAAILFDENVNAGARASILREGEDIHTRPDLAYLYWEISDARIALLQAIFDAHGEKVVEMYKSIESQNRPGPHIEQIHQRSLKHHLFTIIAAGMKPSVLSTRQSPALKVDVSALARQLLASPFMTDQLFAFSQFLQGPASAAEKDAVMEEVKNKFSAHPDSIETYIGVLTGLDSDDAPSIIRKLIRDPIFNVSLAGHARTAVRMWAGIRKRSLLTEDGLALTVELFEFIGKVNQYSAQSFIAALNDLDKFPIDEKKRLVTAVRKMRDSMDPVQQESLCNQLNAILANYKDL